MLDARWKPYGDMHWSRPWWKQIRPPGAMDGGVWFRADGVMVLILDETYRSFHQEDADAMDQLAAYGCALNDLLELAEARCEPAVVAELRRPARASRRRVSGILASVDRRFELPDLLKLAAVGGGP